MSDPKGPPEGGLGRPPTAGRFTHVGSATRCAAHGVEPPESDDERCGGG